ncbi:MAG: hypothetical protein ACRCXB_20930 [Aeromonadaceae bacterium]
MSYDLKYSLIFGIISRIITLINQIFAVPLVIYIIGIEGFTKLNILTAGVSWVFSIGGTLLPSLVGDITRANHDSDLEKIYKVIFNSVFCLIIFSVLSTLFFLIFFSDKANPELVFVFIVSILNLVFSISENIRIGLHQNYKNNIYYGVANLISLLLVFFCYLCDFNIGLIGVIFITLGIPMLSKMCNFFALKSYMSIKLKYFDLIYQFDLIKKAVGFVFITMSYFLNTSGLILVAEIYNKSFIGEFIILQKFALITMGVIVMIRNPLWSLIYKEVHLGNQSIVYFKYRDVIKKYILVSPVFLLIGLLSINEVIYAWSSSTVEMDKKTAIIFSIYLVVQGLSFINSVMYYGMELFNKIAVFLVLESAVNISLFVMFNQWTFDSIMSFDIDHLFFVMVTTSFIANVAIFNVIKERICLE